jgi:LPS sulfotransferase NodH
VHLSRRNKVAQAVSRLKAEQTGLWHRAADGSERERTAPAQPAVYDGAHLAAFVAEAVADDAAWDPWFQSQQITPLRLSYEELSADPGGALARILVELGRIRRRAAPSRLEWRDWPTPKVWAGSPASRAKRPAGPP